MKSFVRDNGDAVTVEIRRRKGTRHLRIRISQTNSVLVSAPWRASDRTILTFIEAQRNWIERQLREAPEQLSLRAWLTRSPVMSLRGQSLSVQLLQVDGGRASYKVSEDTSIIVIRLGDFSSQALLKVVRSLARVELAQRTEQLALQHHLSFEQVSVRDQSSRWGSCSARRGISLNWRLLLLDPSLQDYIILHELAHLTEMNHSARFYELLETYDPDRVHHEAELNRVSQQLMRVERAR